MEGKLLPLFAHKSYQREDPLWNHCWFTCSQTNGIHWCASCSSALWQSTTSHMKMLEQRESPFHPMKDFFSGWAHRVMLFCNGFCKVHVYWWIHLPYSETVWHKSCWGAGGTTCSAGVLWTPWATPAQHQSRDIPCLTADFQQNRRKQATM